jgi:hypothetical protein
LAEGHCGHLNSPHFVEPPGFTGINAEAFWSADSKWAAFPVVTELRKIRVPDGAPEVIGRLPSFNRGGAWAQDGTLLVTSTNDPVWYLYVLRPGAGSFERLTVPGLSEGEYFHPEFLPDSLNFLFAFHPRRSHDSKIYLATLDGARVKNPVRLMTNETAVHFTPANGGQILFVRNDNLYSRGLNLSQRKLVDDPVLVHVDVTSAPAYAGGFFRFALWPDRLASRQAGVLSDHGVRRQGQFRGNQRPPGGLQLGTPFPGRDPPTQRVDRRAATVRARLTGIACLKRFCCVVCVVARRVWVARPARLQDCHARGKRLG